VCGGKQKGQTLLVKPTGDNRHRGVLTILSILLAASAPTIATVPRTNTGARCAIAANQAHLVLCLESTADRVLNSTITGCC